MRASETIRLLNNFKLNLLFFVALVSIVRNCARILILGVGLEAFLNINQYLGQIGGRI